MCDCAASVPYSAILLCESALCRLNRPSRISQQKSTKLIALKILKIMAEELLLFNFVKLIIVHVIYLRFKLHFLCMSKNLNTLQ